MCGFCGIYHAIAEHAIDHELVRDMSVLMRERGPDAEGFYFGSRIGLAHRRLNIIDLSAGEQPVYNEDGTILVVFNGEIFNYQELRSTLQQRGHVFRTATDTEVIVHAYEEYAEDCVEHFRGMFAFAVYDTRSESLFLARDRLGIKPLYYAIDGDTIAFASEVKPLLMTRGGRAEPEPTAIDFFLSVGYVPGSVTMFRGIRKLLPGHTLRWSRGSSEPLISRYWDVPATPVRQLRLAEAEEQFAALLRESVKLRMISDVPLGAFLSGGLDSSVIVSLMQQQSSSPIKTYSIGYSDSAEHSELPYARIVADHLQTDHHEHFLTPGDLFQDIESFVLRSEEPIVESAGIALFHLARRAKRDVTVVLSGEGGDEVLAGYPLYQLMRKVEHLRMLGLPLGMTAAGGVAARWLASEKLVKYLDWLNASLPARYQSIPSDVTPNIRNRMFASAFPEPYRSCSTTYFRDLYSHLVEASPLKRMSYVDIKSWLPDDLLVKADKMTMAASVELRVPFLDHKLVEFCLSLPDNLRLHGDTGKYLLKRVARQWLPEEIIYRKKQGFPVPISKWFRNELYERVAEVLLDRSASQRGYTDRGYVENILARHKAGKGDYSRRILSLLILEMWHRLFVDDICVPIKGLRRGRSASVTIQ